MRKTISLAFAAVAAIALSACADTGTDPTQTQAIPENEPAIEENAPAAVPEQSEEMQQEEPAGQATE